MTRRRTVILKLEISTTCWTGKTLGNYHELIFHLKCDDGFIINHHHHIIIIILLLLFSYITILFSGDGEGGPWSNEVYR